VFHIIERRVSRKARRHSARALHIAALLGLANKLVSDFEGAMKSFVVQDLEPRHTSIGEKVNQNLFGGRIVVWRCAEHVGAQIQLREHDVAISSSSGHGRYNGMLRLTYP
jgi:hypothetical protein